MLKKAFLPLICILIFYSCKKEVEIVNLHYDYFPIKTGTWVAYNVDSIAHNDNLSIMSINGAKGGPQAFSADYVMQCPCPVLV